MKKKAKVSVKTKWSDQINWTICGNCGHTVYGTTTLGVNTTWPEPVNVPKK